MFTVNCEVSWLKGSQTFQLTDIRDIYVTYPTINKLFFQHLVSNIQSDKKYFAESGLKRIFDSQKQEFEPHQWIFVWAEDFKGRFFYILFTRSPDYGGNGALAAAGPPEFAQFLRGEGKPAVLATLTLLNRPDKIKSVAVIVSSNPPNTKIVEKIKKITPQLQQFSQWINQLKSTKNVEGQWFPSYVPKCPVCNGPLVGLTGYKVGFAQIVCPQCGYSRKA